jgi:hypothetical protein
VVRVLFGLFLVAHGLIHAGFVSRAPATTPGAPEWPFEMSRSWLITGAGLDVGVVRTIGAALVVATVVAFAGAGLAWLGIVVPSTWWSTLTIVGAASSLAVLIAFFHPWLVLGFAIDALLIYLVAVSGWSAETSVAP